MNLRQYTLPALLAGAALLPLAASAATITGNLPVKIIITGACTFDSGDMDFGSHDNIKTDIETQGSITITCTETLPYSIALNQGMGSGATADARKMSHGSNTITYELYSDKDHTTQLGDGSAGTSTLSETGTGTAQNIPVYGRVRSQATPPGTYTDTVTATITW